MGFWKKLGGIGAMVGGGVLSFLPGGQVAGPALLAGGAALLGNDAETEAAKEAVASQERATNEALALQDRMYQQSRADLSPYMGYSSGAMSNLGAMVGLPAPTNPAAAAPSARPMGSSIGSVALGAAQRRAPTTATAKEPHTKARVATASAYRPSSIGASSGRLIRMVSPDGRSERFVDPAEVDSWKARGAVEV